jgi:hypothetical protein
MIPTIAIVREPGLSMARTTLVGMVRRFCTTLTAIVRRMTRFGQLENGLKLRLLPVALLFTAPEPHA